MLSNIVITGPESTGKSSLSLQLSEHFQCPLVPEIAREYLSQRSGNYCETDLHAMAQLQIDKQLETTRSSKLVVCDTDLLTFIIWWEFKYGSCPQPWVDLWKRNLPDLYLLMDIDLPWEDDPLREHPHLRSELLYSYQEKLASQNVPTVLISGTGIERLERAKTAISRYGITASK